MAAVDWRTALTMKKVSLCFDVPRRISREGSIRMLSTIFFRPSFGARIFGQLD